MQPLPPAAESRLRPLVGTLTATCVGMGVAIGSGIFRNPGEVAKYAREPAWMIGAWLFGGFFFTLAGLLIAELATRFPRSGGEYVYLRHAYGDFVAFFFGWAYTIFIIGGGIATMAVAFGDFAYELFAGKATAAATAPSELFHLTPSGLIGAAAIVAVMLVNLAGLRAGAAVQDGLTILKVLALLAIVVGAAVMGRPIAWGEAASAMPGVSPWALFAMAMMPVMWCYEGTTDAAKLTEEVRNPRRSMPASLIGANVLVTVVYVLLNLAFLRVLSPGQMAESRLVAADVLGQWMGPTAGRVVVALSMGVVLGAISSVMVSCVRIPYALGRDGLAFTFLGRMSPDQAPVGALLVASGLAVVLTFLGVYEKVLAVYTIASGVLFGLVNLSLLVFRMRERRGGGIGAGEADHFRCPAGAAVSVFLAVVQFVIAALVGWNKPKLAVHTLLLMAGIAALYAVWPKRGAKHDASGAN